MEVSELVRTVVREVLEQLGELREDRGSRKPAVKACVMVLAERDEQAAAKVLEHVGDEAELVFFGEDAGSLVPGRYIVPRLTCGDMAELAAGRASGPVPAEILRLLLCGTEVETLEFEYRSYSGTAPGPLYRLYETYEKTLAAYGLTGFKRAQPDTVRIREDLVTAKDVDRAHENGASVLMVPVTAKITPLAVEAAESRHIAILKRL